MILHMERYRPSIPYGLEYDCGSYNWARMAAKEDTNTTTILIVNHNDWTSHRIPLTINVDIHTIATIPPHTIQYSPTSEWPKYYHYVEASLTSIIRIHSQTNLAPNLQTPQELTH